MHKRLAATFGILCAIGAAQACADDDFRAGLTLRAGFGGTRQQDWTPHLVASFGSGPEFLQQGRSSEAHCLMTAGDLRISGAVSAASSCNDAPLLQFDVGGEGLGSANLMGLNLLKAPKLIDATHTDLLSGNSEWVQWTLKRHEAETLNLNLDSPETRLPQLRVK